MRRRIALLAAVMLGGVAGCGDEGSSPAPAGANAWQRLADPPLSPREGALGVWTGREVLLIGGRDADPCPPGADCAIPDAPALSDGAAFDPEAGTWRRIAQAPTGIAGAKGVTVDETAYIWAPGGPRRSDDPHAFLAYGFDRDRWQELPVPTRRDRVFSLAEAGDRIVAFLDSDEYGESPDFIFDPASSRWSELPADPLSPSFDRAMTWSGDELILIAKDVVPQPGANGPLFVEAAALDPESGSWRRLPESQVLDMGLTGCWVEVDGRVVNPSVGEHDSGGRWERAYPDGGVLDPATGEWSELPERPDGADTRYDGGVFTSTGGRCLNPGGWVLDAPAWRWQRVPELNDRPTDGQTVVGAGDGILAFGGVAWGPDQSRGRLLNRAWLWSGGE